MTSSTTFAETWQPNRSLCAWLTLFVAVCASSQSFAAAPPLDMPNNALTARELGVVIAEGDPYSEAVGAYYVSKRRIPAQNVVRIKLSTVSSYVSATSIAAIKAQVDAALPTNVQATLLIWAQPTIVYGAPGVDGAGCNMSITSAMALGIGSAGPGTAYCQRYGGTASMGQVAVNPYFNSDSSTPWQDYGMRPSMILGVQTIEQAKALIDRGVAADGSFPKGDGYFLRTSDSARSSPRASDFKETVTVQGPANGLNLKYIDNSLGKAANALNATSNILFYFTGLANVPDIASNQFVPGAIADNLTSNGGNIPSGQTNVLDWLTAGATGSYGTVEEPLPYSSKFAKASILVRNYVGGSSLIESYWRSVQQPGEGLFVGEPLARPYPDSNRSITVSPDGKNYVVTTRSLASNKRYLVEYQQYGAWRGLASIVTPDLPRATRTYTFPVPPQGASAARIVGPCASLQPFNYVLMGGDGATAPLMTVIARQSTSVDWQVLVYDLPSDICSRSHRPIRIQSLKSSIGNTGLIAPGSQFSSLPTFYMDTSAIYQSWTPTFVSLTVDSGIDMPIVVRSFVPADLASGNYTQLHTLSNEYGEKATFALQYEVQPSRSAGSLRIQSPQAGWYIPLKTRPNVNGVSSFSSMKIQVDGAPDSAAVGMRFRLLGYDGSVVLKGNLIPSYSQYGQLYYGTPTLMKLGEGFSDLVSLIVESVDDQGQVLASQRVDNIVIY